MIWYKKAFSIYAIIKFYFGISQIFVACIYSYGIFDIKYPGVRTNLFILLNWAAWLKGKCSKYYALGYLKYAQCKGFFGLVFINAFDELSLIIEKQ